MRWRPAKVGVFAVSLVPLGQLARGFQTNSLGPNPVETITHETGDWTFRFLLLCLAVTPARRMLGQPWLIQYRRMLGLFAFFYCCLHFTTWFWLDKAFDPGEMWVDIVKRRFITVGMTGFALMIPLAITSTAGWIRRMGGKNWNRVHQATYLAGVAGVVHYWWLVKSDIRMPALYGALLAMLLGWRAWKKVAGL